MHLNCSMQFKYVFQQYRLILLKKTIFSLNFLVKTPIIFKNAHGAVTYKLYLRKKNLVTKIKIRFLATKIPL